MNPSITTKENGLYKKTRHRIVQKKNDWSPDSLSTKMGHLCHSIDDICRQPSVPLDEILKPSNSTLGKLFQLFLSLRDKKDNLLNPNEFDHLIIQKIGGLLIQLNQTNKYPMNFIQFIKQIEISAKENQLNKEYLYKKLLHETTPINNRNENNNAFESSPIFHTSLLNEYNNDLSDLKSYFIRHCGKSRDKSDDQMSCSTFIECISRHIQFNKMANRLQLNDIFNKIYSSLVNEGVYIPASHTIDFHGFILCLQQIAQTFHFNLRILIKTLIHPKNKSRMI